ncbi:MAG: YggS family pyridoxal phosphate-dependent enzyme, partial [Syntrophomonadaceae bacterium]|nr:YggS family pyridoxal phosphate-dependent enzyme [Syntrophomonadaceae bacterium]
MRAGQEHDLGAAIAAVRERIRRAALRVGRAPQEVTLIGVTKTVGLETVAEAIRHGLRDFGENRVQEFVPKQQAFPGVRWHFIGRLQTNKVNAVVGRAHLIHSLDRWRLAEYIDGRAQRLGIEVPVLLQVNVAGESAKAGIAPAEVADFLGDVQRLRGLRVEGLMTIAPESDNVEEARPVFRMLRELLEQPQGGVRVAPRPVLLQQLAQHA